MNHTLSVLWEASAMTSFKVFGVKRRWVGTLAALAVALFLGGALAALPEVAAAQATAKPGTTALADDEFTRQLGELKKTFGDVGKQIEAGTHAIDSLKKPEDGRKGIEELRQHVSRLLGAVADNGEVAKLGQMALQRAEQKMQALAQDT